MDDEEENNLIQKMGGKGSVSIFDRLLFRNFFYVSGRTPADQTANLRREPSAHLAIVTCSDCQVDIHNIFQLRPGDAITLQNGGNVSNQDLIRSLIVAVYELGVTHIVILGHVQCSFKDLNVDHIEIKTYQAANINAQSFGFSDPKVFYRPFDDVLDNTIQQAKILQVHPLFKQRVEILPMLLDDATGFVYNADLLQSKRTTLTPKSTTSELTTISTGEYQIEIKPDTQKEIVVEIQKLIEKFPNNDAFVLKVLRNWQWDKYVTTRPKTAPHKETSRTTFNMASLTDVLKSAAAEKLTTLNKVIASVPSTLSATPSEDSSVGKEGGNIGTISERNAQIEKASGKTATTTQLIANTINTAQQAIPKQLLTPIPRVVIPKIPVPRVRIPRLHFVIEYPEEENARE